METNQHSDHQGIRNSRIGTGVLLLLIGLLLLAYKMGAPIPGWIFSWPVILIAIGLLIGIKSRFQNPGAFIMILIGAVFLADRSIPGINFQNFLVPALLIGLGIIFILRPKGHPCKGRPPKKNRDKTSILPPDNAGYNDEETSSGRAYNANDGEYIEVQAVLGGVKKRVQSKNFRGGEIVSFLGGSEINFMQADIQEPVNLEVHSVFGGTKLIIPPNWDIQNSISAMFGGVEDKRVFNSGIPDPHKKIFLKGSCVFGGVEITNY